MNKKYGILTWYKTYNYGSALQAYALQTVIKNLGYDCEFINYQGHLNNKSVFKLKRILNKIKKVPFYKQIKEKSRLFNAFINDNINESKLCGNSREIRSLEDNYLGFICGSDQIWTPTPNGFDPTYVLDFASDNIKKISYAPSIGYPRIIDKYKNDMKELISRFDFISIREEHGAKIIKELTGRDSKVVLDPTLLLSQKEWEAFCVDPNLKEPYILCYFLGNRIGVRNFARELKKITGYKLVVIPVLDEDLFFGDITKINVGPKEFVGLVKNAEYVCSDSYHATIFSINLGTNFFALKRHEDSDIENQNLRIVNMLERLNLSDRFVNSDDYNIGQNLNMDFSKSNQALELLRNDSVDYLKKALK